jgi:hypothetical protein
VQRRFRLFPEAALFHVRAEEECRGGKIRECPGYPVGWVSCLHRKGLGADSCRVGEETIAEEEVLPFSVIHRGSDALAGVFSLAFLQERKAYIESLATGFCWPGKRHVGLRLRPRCGGLPQWSAIGSLVSLLAEHRKEWDFPKRHPSSNKAFERYTDEEAVRLRWCAVSMKTRRNECS